MQAVQPEQQDAYRVLGLHASAPYDLVQECYWLQVSTARAKLSPREADRRVREFTAAYEEISAAQQQLAGRVPARKQPGNVVDLASSRTGRAVDYYELLQVDAAASVEVINLAYRVLLRKALSGQRTKASIAQLEQARLTLVDPVRREEHDARLRRLSGVAAEWIREGPFSGGEATPLPEEICARTVLTGTQRAAGISLVLLVVLSLLVAARATLLVLVALAATAYLVSIGYKAYLVLQSMISPCETPVDPAQLAAMADEDLPVYTLMLPVYHEHEVLAALVESVSKLDYPRNRLDVKLLVEEDDDETLAAVSGMDLPPYFEVLVVPDVGPRGKPRACNCGLRYARGTYVVLYDAEDRPEPDQLKKALLAFAAGGESVACVQAKLNFYNRDQNLLTRWFTVEYSTWFDLYLPGLNHLQAPIPLGGTSNHFRVRQLREIGGWDPYNVTEDADLGVRLARQGLRTSVIDSVTYEEANSQLGNWLRQRSRWVKGYIQTWLVHMRHPERLYGDLGPAGFLAFQVMVLGTFLAYFLNPIFWFLVVAWYATHAAAIEALYPGPLLYVSALEFLAGNFLFVLVAVMGALRRGYFQGVKYAFASHLYWALMSIAAFKGLAQLVTKPHYWEKTRHGLDRAAARSEASAS